MPPLSTFAPSEIPTIVLLMSIAAPIGALSMGICHWLAVRSPSALVAFCVAVSFLSAVLASSTYDLGLSQERLVQSFVLCWPAAAFYYKWRQEKVNFLPCFLVVFFACVLSLYLGSLLAWHSIEIRSLLPSRAVISLRPGGILRIYSLTWEVFFFYASLQLAPIITVAFTWMLLALKRRPGFDLQSPRES